mmetsp:Transcript_131134/g.355998  ORF Transcript_131134/g.355998 Transcript_131134/m.355998 type:complete len:736 (-) Transcript_131134:89-2296(-)
MKLPRAAAPAGRPVAVLVAVLSAALGRCHARLARQGDRGIVLRAQEVKVYPVSKVVALLKDMQKELEKEADEDEEVYDKMSCWCKTNDKEKTQAVADAQARVAQLETVIEESTARSARLGTEIKGHEEDLAKSKKSLDEETAIREKQAAEFNTEEKLMLQNIRALDSAIAVLSKHHASASLIDNGEVAQALKLARSMMQRHEMLLLDAITPEQRRLIMALPQMGSRQEPGPGTGYYGQQPTFKQAYVPASSEVFGILKQMKETFESNLSETQKDALSDAKAFEELKAAKEAEIQATTQALEQKKVQLAETDEKHAQATQDIEDTKASLSSDQQFLLNLQESCALTDQEWEERQKMRQEELTAVAQAISVLSSDEARDQFSKSFNPSFLQEARRAQPHGRGAGGAGARRQRVGAARRQQLANVSAGLAKAAQKVHSPKLLALSVAVRLDPLTKVKEAINTLISELLDEKQVETKKRDSCVELIHDNELQTEAFTRDREGLESQEAVLKAEISEAEEAMKTLSAEITELHVQIKRAGEDREAENKDFQTTIVDQQETQKLLQKALQILKAVYKPTVAAGGAAALAQQAPGGGEDQPAPPPGFREYGQNRAGGGVVAMIEQIISDAHHMEEMATKDEQTAQQQYETFVKDTNTAVQDKQQSLVNKGEVHAKAKGKLIEVEGAISESIKELETLGNTRATLRQDCDFLLKNFDIRQEARDEEVEALREALAVLSGMKLE